MLEYSRGKIAGILLLIIVCMVIFGINRLGFLFNEEMLNVTISGNDVSISTEASSIFINTDPSLSEMIIETKDSKEVLTSGSKHIELQPMSNAIITLPEGVDVLSVNTISGLVDINTTAEKAEVKTASGNIRISDFEGENLTADTTSGDIRCEAITAESINISSASGMVETGELNAESLSMNTVSGNASIYLDNVSKGTLSSVSGNITVEAENPSLYHISTASTNGIVNVSSAYNGKNTIQINTASGNISAL